MENQNRDKKILRILALAVAALVGFTFMMCVFGMGIWVGQKRAEFSFRWAENYHRNFGGPTSGIFGDFSDQDFTSAHGAAGVVLTIDGNNLIIRGQQNLETKVLMLLDTIAVNQLGKITLTTIKVGDNVVVIGSPNNQGLLEAKFIRVFPPNVIMPGSYMMSTSCSDSNVLMQ